jgi:hypothetical protein
VDSSDVHGRWLALVDDERDRIANLDHPFSPMDDRGHS